MTKRDRGTDRDKTGHLSAVDLLQTDRHGHTSIEVSVVRQSMSGTTKNTIGFLRRILLAVV